MQRSNGPLIKGPGAFHCHHLKRSISKSPGNVWLKVTTKLNETEQ